MTLGLSFPICSLTGRTIPTMCKLCSTEPWGPLGRDQRRKQRPLGIPPPFQDAAPFSFRLCKQNKSLSEQRVLCLKNVDSQQRPTLRYQGLRIDTVIRRETLSEKGPDPPGTTAPSRKQQRSATSPRLAKRLKTSSAALRRGAPPQTTCLSLTTSSIRLEKTKHKKQHPVQSARSRSVGGKHLG